MTPEAEYCQIAGPRLRQVARRRETVVASLDHDDVVVRHRLTPSRGKEASWKKVSTAQTRK